MAHILLTLSLFNDAFQVPRLCSVEWLGDDEFERMWKKMIMACCTILAQHFLEQPRKDMENFNEGSWPPSQPGS
jgi:hypothetical protein